MVISPAGEYIRTYILLHTIGTKMLRSVNYRIRFPGFKVHVVCFSPNLQDVEGCTATPIDQLFPSVGRRKRSTKTKARVVMDVANSEELMEQFIEAVTQCTEQVYGSKLCIRRYDTF